MSALACGGRQSRHIQQLPRVVDDQRQDHAGDVVRHPSISISSDNSTPSTVGTMTRSPTGRAPQRKVTGYRKQYGFDTISLMPTNLYGPGDNFHAENSHVLPALLRRFHEARLGSESEVVVWGSGEPRREFLHVDDLADAAVYLMDSYCDPEIINVGTGTDVSIRELAELIAEVVGYRGKVRFDTSRPDEPRGNCST